MEEAVGACCIQRDLIGAAVGKAGLVAEMQGVAREACRALVEGVAVGAKSSVVGAGAQRTHLAH